MAGGNHLDTTGYVVRWDRIIVPDSGDGTGSFTVRAEATVVEPDDDPRRAYPLGGFLLQEVGPISDCPPGDLTGDCIVNIDDLLVLSGDWMSPVPNSGDINNDGYANMWDLDALAADWLVDRQTGTVTVTITPAGAIDAGAQWQVDGGDWHDSGQSLQLPD